jgi:chloramphenicol-sensitive protein RarD
MNQYKYFLTGISSYAIWGFLPIFFKLMTEYNPYDIILYRIIMAAIVMIIISLFIRKQVKKDIKNLLNSEHRLKTIILTIVGSACLVLNWTIYIYVVNKISINASAFAYFILPIFTAFLAKMILKEKLNRNKYIGILLSSISCALLANIGLNEILYVLIVTLSYAFYMISQRRNTVMSRQSSLTVQMIIGSLLMLIINPNELHVTNFDLNFYILVLLIAVFFTVLPLFLNLFALNGLESSQLAFLIYISPITTFLLSVLVYKEEFSWMSVIAYCFLFVAILFFNWDLFKSVKEKVSKRLKLT